MTGDASPEITLATDLRDALVAADFTYDAVAEALGPQAHRALSRNETTPGVRRTADGSALSTLTRLFLLQAPATHEEAERALPGLVDRLCNAGLLQQSVGEVAARMDCRPYSSDDVDLWVVSDLTPGLDGAPTRVGADHVLGISSASTSLAQLTVRDEGRPRAGPRDGLRRTSPAPGDPRGRGRRHRRQPARAVDDSASMRRSTGSRSTCATARSSSPWPASCST